MAGDVLQSLFSTHPGALDDFLRRANDLWVVGCERSGTIVFLNAAASPVLDQHMGRSIHSLLGKASTVPRLAAGERKAWTGEFALPMGEAWRVSGSWIGLGQQLILICDSVLPALTALATVAPTRPPVPGSLQAMSDSMEDTYRRLHEQNTKLVATNKSMARLAHTDTLTGLNNRRALDTEISRLEAPVLDGTSSLSALVCDLDHFKLINDTHGHSTGDAVLRKFGSLVKRQTRTTDLAMRWGGEEFLVLVPGMQLDRAAKRAESLREEVARTVFADGKATVTVSIGVGQMSKHESMKQFIQRVDEALYEAKRLGRNQVVRSAEPRTALRLAQ